MSQLVNEYFGWMCQLIDYDVENTPIHYQKLLNYLYSIEFTYTIRMDANRADDGVQLRYRFGYDNDIPKYYIEKELDNRPCSVLEMMVALSLKCEEHIMSDPDIGDRTGLWFWEMIKNLGLKNMTDDNWDLQYADIVILRFLTRSYEPNGKNGLFTLNHCEHDLREVEIWYQMMWYLNENFDFSI